MATSADDSSAIHLITKEFPPEFENVYRPRPQSLKQNSPAERVLLPGADHRQRIVKVDTPAPGSLYDSGSGFPFIGLLRIEFNGRYSMGTATLIANGSALLTCAHNVVEYDRTTKTFVNPTSLWFELRENNQGSGSVLIKRYQVTKTVVHPAYSKNRMPDSGSDLALCWIDVPDDDRTIKELYSNHPGHAPIPVSGSYNCSKAAVVGFPCEHNGEKWGMIADVPSSKAQCWKFGPCLIILLNIIVSLPILRNEPDVLEYDFIDTSPGQSGSPVMGMKPADVIGVHTGASDILNKNWATRITPAKLQWIARTLGHPWMVYGEHGTLLLRNADEFDLHFRHFFMGYFT